MSVQLLPRGGIWACMRCPCLCLCWVLGWDYVSQHPYCDDICMRVLDKQFELLEFVCDFIHVYLQYDEISLTFTSGYASLCCVCSLVVVHWSVCGEVVVVPYVDTVVAVTVMRVLLFVLRGCVLRECDGARVTVMLVWGMDDVWLWSVQGMWVIDVVQVVCLVQLTCNE